MIVTLLEAEDAPGGRVRTDHVDGFRLDRGFQLVLTGYPDLPQHFDIRALRLRHFAHGFLVHYGGRFHHFVDPFRGAVADALGMVLDPMMTLGDKICAVRLRRQVCAGEPASVFRLPETTTRHFLERYRFSTRMIERVFAPLVASAFLERELVTSSRCFQFLLRMLAIGNAAVPELGMETLPRQLAVRLRTDTLRTCARVTGLRRTERSFVAETATEHYTSPHVILALDDAQVRALTNGWDARPQPPVTWNRSTTFYYAASRSPIDGPVLALNGDGPASGPINHVAVPSQASERYAPPGAHLVAASVVGRAPQQPQQIEQLEREVRAHLGRWFGSQVARWTILGGYPNVQALPLFTHAEWEQSSPRLTEGLYACGGASETPSIQGPLASGRRAADALLRDAC